MQAYYILPLALAGLLAAPLGFAQSAVNSSPGRFLSNTEVHTRTLDRSIYGYFYQRLRESKNPQDRQQFLAEHDERMQARAKVYGDTLPPPPSMGSR